MTEETTMVRVPNQFLEKAKQQYPETKGLSATALVEFLLRKALKKETS